MSVIRTAATAPTGEIIQILTRFAADGTHGPLDHQAFAAMLSKQFAEWPGRIKTLGISAE